MALSATFKSTPQETKKLKKLRVLILTKKSSDYSGEVNFKSGLNNTADFLAEELIHNLNIEAKFVACTDGNNVDKEIFDYKPTHVVLEAIWVTPLKLREIQGLHPKVIFTVRVHSKITFLAYEGMAIEWLKKYPAIKNVYVSFNSLETFQDFKVIIPEVKLAWLPNIYKKIDYEKISTLQSVLNFLKHPKKYEFNVACFGAIRPMKDILLQALAAMKYSDQHKLKLIFHINAGRVEQKGDSTLKNLQALFENTKHALVEHDWLSHKEFAQLIKVIDLGMQVSLNESFNVVTADYVFGYKPIVVSDQVHWVSKASHCHHNIDSIVEGIRRVLNDTNLLKENLQNLHSYNEKSLEEWRRWLFETVI